MREHIVLIHSFFNGCLIWFCILALLNCLAVNMRMQVLLLRADFTSLGCLPRRGSYEELVIFEQSLAVLHSSYTNLHPHQQCVGLPFLHTSHPHQNLLIYSFCLFDNSYCSWNGKSLRFTFPFSWYWQKLSIFSVFLWAICISSEKCALESFVHFLTEWFAC